MLHRFGVLADAASKVLEISADAIEPIDQMSPLLSTHFAKQLARVVFAGCLSFVAVAQAKDVERAIRRVEQSLLPPVIVKGEAPDTSTLQQQMAQSRVPGVSIAVVRKGRIEWARGFGAARMGGPPVTPDTLFQAASISKPITALGVLRLVEQGKLILDEDVDAI